MTDGSRPELSPTPLPASGTPAARPGELHLADIVAEEVLAVPGVASLHSGMFGEVATYLPGRRVHGVQIHDDVTQVHVVLYWGLDIGAAAEVIKSAVQPLVGTPVDVTVQDLVEPVESR